MSVIHSLTSGKGVLRVLPMLWFMLADIKLNPASGRINDLSSASFPLPGRPAANHQNDTRQHFDGIRIAPERFGFGFDQLV